MKNTAEVREALKEMAELLYTLSMSRLHLIEQTGDIREAVETSRINGVLETSSLLRSISIAMTQHNNGDFMAEVCVNCLDINGHHSHNGDHCPDKGRGLYSEQKFKSLVQ